MKIFMNKKKINEGGKNIFAVPVSNQINWIAFENPPSTTSYSNNANRALNSPHFPYSPPKMQPYSANSQYLTHSSSPFFGTTLLPIPPTNYDSKSTKYPHIPTVSSDSPPAIQQENECNHPKQFHFFLAFFPFYFCRFLSGDPFCILLPIQSKRFQDCRSRLWSW